MIRHRVHWVLVREGDVILGVTPASLTLMSLTPTTSHLIALQIEQATSVTDLQAAAQQNGWPG